VRVASEHEIGRRVGERHESKPDRSHRPASMKLEAVQIVQAVQALRSVQNDSQRPDFVGNGGG
jgi:hypothetical protein